MADLKAVRRANLKAEKKVAQKAWMLVDGMVATKVEL